MKSRFVRMFFGLPGVFLALTSCSPAVPGPQAGGGIGGTGSLTSVASGPVTKFGSVFVSGTEYDTSATIYCLDDEPCTSENRLKLGMVVLVNGTVTEQYALNQPLTRKADRITYEETVEGIVQWVAPDGLSLVVLGQTIHVDQNTVIDPSVPGQSIARLQPGTDLVEVSGLVAPDGQILATLIMMQTGTPHYEVQGAIGSHDITAKTFQIGALIVDYAAADVGGMPASTALWNGLVVHIRGDRWTQGGPGPYGARLTATRVKPLSLGVSDSPDAEVEGFIIQTNGPGDFWVNNVRVQTSGTTAIEGGTVNDLVVGTHVEIHGQISNGVLQAEQVSLEGDLELESTVASLDGGPRTLTLNGLSGMTVQIDNNTALDGEGNLRRFEDLRLGDHLKIHGRSSGGLVLATELERSGPSTLISLQGPLQSALDPQLVIAGALIDTTGLSDGSFTGRYGTVIGRTAFFQGLTIGRMVSVKGTWTGSTAAWTSVGLNE